MSIFGTSGIRDLCPSIVNANLAACVANIICAGSKQIAIAYDSRRTGQMLKSASLCAAMQAGAHAHDLDVCPTPTLAYFSQINKCPAMMITASHNPYEYNGIKLFENGHELSHAKEVQIEKKLNSNSPLLQKDWNACGQSTDSHAPAIEAHISLIKNFVDSNSISKKRPKIIVDCANMAGSTISARALEACGCTVIKENCLAGEISPRPLEPKAENLEKLCEQTVLQGADFAIAHDGDADRAIIIDELGKTLGLDVQLAIATKYILKKHAGAKIISTVESSLSLRETIESLGGSLEITPVGSMRVGAKMREGSCVFGGEPCGEYIFKDATLAPDGILAGAFFAEIFANEGKLSTLASKVKTYPIKRDKIACENSKKAGAMKKIEKEWPFSTPNKSDGLRSDEKWGWVLIRPSGTESFVRITIEAKDEKSLLQNYEKIKKIVLSCCN